jgi:peptidylprolyl isomerase
MQAIPEGLFLGDAPVFKRTFQGLVSKTGDVGFRYQPKEKDMEKVENGLYVQVEYRGSLADGSVFDSSEGRPPLEVQMGCGQLIQGFENALAGMRLNEEKNITLTPEEAYGHRDEEQKRTFSRAEVPPKMNPQVGQTVALSGPGGQQVPGTITGVDTESITVDLNHPLAGKTLVFDIKVVGITTEPTQMAPACGCGCDAGASDAGCGCDGGDCSSGCR